MIEESLSTMWRKSLMLEETGTSTVSRRGLAEMQGGQ